MNKWIIALMMFAGSAMANQVFLGSTELSPNLFDVDRDQIYLGDCRGGDNTPVTAVQIRVERNDVYLERINATFGNGEVQEFYVRDHFRRNSQSRWIDLRGNRRCIKSFRLVGRSEIDLDDGFGGLIGSLRSARVELWGERRRGHGGGGNGRIDNGGRIERLARVDMNYGRNDRFSRHRARVDECGVREFRVKSRGGRLKVRNFKVRYRNGDVENVRFRTSFFRDGDVSRWVRTGNGRRGRCIERISFGGFSPNDARLILQGR